jgi:membrane associated rhomboid family serine protease
MLNNLVNALQEIFVSVGQNWRFLGLIALIVFAIQIVNLLLGYRLNLLGIYPRKIHGLIGIFFTPALHGSFQHLFFNAIPFIILGSLVLVSGKSVFLEISFFIILMSGLLIWLFGRPAFHIGASALIVGYWGFLLSNAYQQHSVMSILLALLCLYYFSGIALSFFPREEKTSWEGHIYGFFSGLAASYAYTHQWIT